MSKSSKVVDGGTSALAAVTPDVSTAFTLVEEGGGGTALDDAPLGREGAALYLRKVIPIGATT